MAAPTGTGLRAGIEDVAAVYPSAQVDDAASFTEAQAATIDQLLAIVTMLLALAAIGPARRAAKVDVLQAVAAT